VERVKQELGGQPLWVWLAGAAVVVGGYLYFKHKSSASSSTAPPAAGSGGGKSTSSSSFKETITELHSNPKPRRKRT